MRIVFLVLVAANLVFFILSQGFPGPILSDRREPEKVKNQVDPERMRLRDGDASLQASANPAVFPSTPSAVLAAQAACVEYGAFAQEESARLAAELAARLPRARISPRSTVETKSYMVYLPPFSTRNEAVQAGNELKRNGITDYFIIDNDSPLKFGISLGILPTEKMAQTQLAALTKKGVSGAEIAARPTTRIWFRIRSDEPDLRASVAGKLAALKARYPKRELRDCSDAGVPGGAD